jgi:hypothetical protein
MKNNISKTALEALRTIAQHPDSCITDLHDKLGFTVPVGSITSLKRRGLIEVAMTVRRKNINGIVREQHLYRITPQGEALLKSLGQEVKPEEKKPPRYAEPGPRSQITLPGSTPKAAPYKGVVVPPYNAAVMQFPTYCPPPPSGRNYTPRPLRSILNL